MFSVLGTKKKISKDTALWGLPSVSLLPGAWYSGLKRTNMVPVRRPLRVPD